MESATISKKHSEIKSGSLQNVILQYHLHRLSFKSLQLLVENVQKYPKQKSHLLSQFLPYDPTVKTGDRLKDGLNEFLLLLIASAGAMDALEKGELKSFDPLVGENACQIRAVKIALIDQYELISIQELRKEILQAKARVEEILATIPNFSVVEASLQHYLDSEKLDIAMNDDEVFLIKSYILSITKVEKPFNLEKPLVENASTDAKKIKEIRKVGSAFSWNFVRHLREKLSLGSVKFVQEIADQMEFSETKEHKVSEEFSIVHNGLQCLPYYWSTRVLLDKAIKNKIPIVMFVQQRAKDKGYETVNKTVLFFQVTEEGYQVTDRGSLELDQPALILMGSTCRDAHELPGEENWKKELLEHNIVDLILAYSAAHRQYPDQSKDGLVTEGNDENYLDHKRKSLEWGCSLENPARFFLSHAFCDKVRNIEAYM